MSSVALPRMHEANEIIHEIADTALALAKGGAVARGKNALSMSLRDWVRALSVPPGQVERKASEIEWFARMRPEPEAVERFAGERLEQFYRAFLFDE